MEGTPGIDFPILSYIPRTSFSCKGIGSGYYADLETDCQVFHICEEEKKISFLCPNGTIFQQSELICEWWFKVNCTDAPQLYEDSAEQLREDLLRRKSARRVSPDGSERFHGAVMRTEESSSVSAKQNGRILPTSAIDDKQNGTPTRRSDTDNVRKRQNDNYNSKSPNGRVSSNQNLYTRNSDQGYNSFNKSPAYNNGQKGKGTLNSRKSEPQDLHRAESNNFNGNGRQNSRNREQNSSKGPNDYSTNPSSNFRYDNGPRPNTLINNQRDKNSRIRTSSDYNNEFINSRRTSDLATSDNRQHNPNYSVQSQNINSSRNSKPAINSVTVNKPKIRRYNDAQTGNTLNDVSTATERYSTTKRPLNNYKEYHVQFSSTSVGSDRGVNSVSTTIAPFKQYTFSQQPNEYQTTKSDSLLNYKINKNNPQSSTSTRAFGYLNTQYQRNNGFTTTVDMNNNYQSVQSAPGSNNYSSYRSSVRNSVSYSRSNGLTTPTPSTTTHHYSQRPKVASNEYYTTPPTYSVLTTTQQNQYFTDHSRNQNYYSDSSNINSNDRGTNYNTEAKAGTSNEVSETLQYTTPGDTTYQDFSQTVSDFTLAVSNTANKNARNGRYDSESADSDEAQIPQESSSFVKSSFNTINNDLQKSSTPNPYPNHRTTYSDLKQPTYPPKSNKFISISSVTPQYITTQPINKGKPFLGSRVGTRIHVATTTEIPLSTTTTKTTTTTKNVIKNAYIAEENKKIAQILLDAVKASASGGPSTQSPPKTISTTYRYSHSTSSPQEAEYYSASTAVPVERITDRTIDHATVYGTYRDQKQTPAPFRESSNGLQVKFGKNSDRIALTLGKSLTGSRSQRYEHGDVKASTVGPQNTYLPLSSRDLDNSANTYKPRDLNKIVKPQTGFGYIPITFNNASTKYSTAVQSPFLNANVKVTDVYRTKPDVLGTGFYVTKKSVFNTSYPTSQASYALQTTTLKPKPFEKSQQSIIPLSTPDNFESVTIPSYKISSASPFRPQRENGFSPSSTVPTPVASTTVSIYDNVDSMINALVKFAESKEPDYSSETPRPGLSVPPSVGPQTLHTLAAYFASALDSIMKDKENLTQEEVIEKKEELTTLLTEMTVHGYNHLFKRSNETNDTSTTLAPKEEEVSESSNSLANTPEIRQLARNFSIALASYLNDPEMFRKDLAELRPKEPAFYEEGTEHPTDNEESPTDEELLNYSDADGKSSYPPIPSPSPTWGFILATKSNDIDVKNSLTGDLNTADSQSFIPSYNHLNQDEKAKDQNDKRYLPEGHWTTSPTVAKLWSSTFGVNPIVVNDQFETTVAPEEADDVVEDFSSPEKLPGLTEPQDEIKYELRTLPKISLNSTQIHGILIDFMNTSSSDSSRLHRLLRKLNTTETEFLNKMKEIESNPLSKRLILLLISECGVKATKDIHNNHSDENLKVSETSYAGSTAPSVEGLTLDTPRQNNSPIPNFVNENLSEDDQDVRALQLLNALYGIASRFGK
ncbi:unnamed protein product [Acanthoscelides obtectus]|nr:unnamed protein product [Acanthoscelides obtectus]CAK1661315.1 hypothetical protein AOBTE_LOCUS22567 [Acanthoscelides obtectus]